MPGIPLSTWMVVDGVEDASEFPAVGGNSSSKSFQDVYWRCIAVWAISARLHNRHREIVVFCNAPIATVAPRDVVDCLARYAVRSIELPMAHRLPRGAVRRWGNVFYEIDILEWLAASDLDGLVITDSDCIWRASFDPYDSRVVEKRFLAYALQPGDQKNYEGEVLINGMTRRRMGQIADELAPDRTRRPRIEILGGEFSALTREFCIEILEDVDRLWHLVLDEIHEEDSIKTEEHVWSIIAATRDIEMHSANDIVRRITTNFEDNNAVSTDMNLALWHLPSEKRYGFQRMWRFLAARQRTASEVNVGEFDQYAARFMGLPRRGAVKLGLDVFEKVRSRLQASP